ncbi:MAG: hypothetical protein ACLRMJ_00790 [Alistipes finegoldii]
MRLPSTNCATRSCACSPPRPLRRDSADGRSPAFVDICRGFLAQTRSTGVRTTPRRPVKRLLMEFVHENACSGLRSDSPPVCSELVVGTGEHEQYTPNTGPNP